MRGMRLEDVRAIVTGGARGLGEACAAGVLRAGGQVVVGDVDARALRDLKDRHASPRLHVAVVDVASEGEVSRFVAQAVERMGTPNVVINNAGILRDAKLVDVGEGGVRALPKALWDRVLAVNLTGTYLVAREAAAAMLAARAPGLIVNVSSLARHGNAGQSAYAASKAAVDACTRTWAIELAPAGVRVVGVAPGVFQTRMLDDIAADTLESLRRACPANRFGEPEEMWRAVKFVIETEFVNGRTIEIDGGASMG